MKKTSLESSSDIVDTLNWKLQDINRSNVPAESAVADYIALAVDNLNKDIQYIKSVEKDYATQRKLKTKQIEEIKVKGAEFFISIGLVKLDGIKCSSITLTKGKESQTTADNKSIFYPLISELEIEELLIELGKAEMRIVTEKKITKEIPIKLRINKYNENNTATT